MFFKERILERYIIRELLPPFFLSISVLTLALFLQKMFRLVEFILSRGSSPAEAGKLLLFIVPSFLVFTLPMSLLVAALTAFTRLSSDSEVTAMKASRISLYTMIQPVMVFALVLFFVTTAIVHFIAPRANYAFKAQLFKLVKSRALVGIEQGVFSSAFDGIIIYVDQMSSPEDMHGIFISDERSGNEPYAITAKQGKLIANPDSLSVTLLMEHGNVHLQPRQEGVFSLISFENGRLYLNIDSASLRGRRSGGMAIDETDSIELIRGLRSKQFDSKTARASEIELNKRLSISYACLIFGLIGAPLGIRRARTGKSAGVAIAIGVILIYYIILGTGANLAETGAASPAAAYWVPNGIITIMAAALVIKKGHEIDLGLSRAAGAVLNRIKSLFQSRRVN